MESMFKKWIGGVVGNPIIPQEIRNNPLVGYLEIYQNQHKVIFALYHGLIFAFSGFLLLVSFLIYHLLESALIPSWGAFLLGAADIVLLLCIVMTFKELNTYRRKSREAITQICRYLKNDIDKLEKLQKRHIALSDAHKYLQNREYRLSGGKKPATVEEYKGWDAQVCPNCQSSVEMLKRMCPHCHFKLGENYKN